MAVKNIRDATQDAMKRVAKQKIQKNIQTKRDADKKQMEKATKVKRDRAEMSEKARELYAKKFKRDQKKH